MSTKILTQEFLKNKFCYEKGNLYFLSGARQGKELGTAVSGGYRRASLCGRCWYLHQLIFLYHYGYLPPRVDHRDRNKLNNDISNLRPSTPSLNAMNAKVNIRSKSGITGVSKHPKGSTWVAKITHNYKPIHLGCFKTKEEAENAVIQAKKKLGAL